MFGLGIHLELVHVGEELGVVARFLEVRDEQLHGFSSRPEAIFNPSARSAPGGNSVRLRFMFESSTLFN
jgi:hypothetical protein